jgi:hypothetical protein
MPLWYLPEKKGTNHVKGTLTFLLKPHLTQIYSSFKTSIVIHSLQQKFSITSGEGSVGRATIIRRDRCMLMLSKSRTRAMVLRFYSLQDCLDFSDRFISLNPVEQENNQCGSVAIEADREVVTAHLIRLMQEPSFVAFVRNIERALANTTDGTRLLESWADRDLDVEN